MTTYELLQASVDSVNGIPAPTGEFGWLDRPYASYDETMATLHDITRTGHDMGYLVGWGVTEDSNGYKLQFAAVDKVLGTKRIRGCQ